jgi:phage baseplate assembly protein V
MSFESTEMLRLISNLIRVGSIHSADYDKSLVRVTIGDLVTDWLPFIAQRAGSSCRSWNPPEVDEQVIILSPGGNLESGIVMPAINSLDHPAPSSNPAKHLCKFGDGATLEYDSVAHELNATLPSGGSAKLTAPAGIDLTCSTGKLTATADVGIDITCLTDKITVDSPFGVDLTCLTGQVNIIAPLGLNVTAAANVTVTGDVIADGVSLKTHTHGGVFPGNASTSEPN